MMNAFQENRQWVAACWMCTVGVVAMVGALNAQTQAGLLKSEFIYEEEPFPSCHASTIVETTNGLMAAWFGGTAERDPDVGIWVSRFEDDQWTVPVEVANGVGFVEKQLQTWNP